MQVARGFTLSSKSPTFSNSKNALDISGNNYLPWKLDTEIWLEAKSLGDTIKKDNTASQQDLAKALIFLRHHIHEVFSEISDAIGGPNGWWRGRSFAASVPYVSPRSPKGRKAEKEERRAMVEAFVDEYRALHAGKYPGPGITRNQVGGSYYTVKKMIQELEHNSNQPLTNMKNKYPLVKDVPKGEYKSVLKVEEVSSSKIVVDLSSDKPSSRIMDKSDTVIMDKLDEATSNDFVEKGLPDSIHVDKPRFEEALDSTKIGDDSCSIMASSKPIILENQEVLQTLTELPKEGVAETAKSEDLLDLNCPDRKSMHEDGQKTLKSETLESDMSRKEAKEDDQFSTRSTLWGNLRSLADEVIKLWRNK